MIRWISILLLLSCNIAIADPSNAQVLSELGAIYARTAAEKTNSVVPVNYGYPPGFVRRNGTVGNCVADDTTAIQNAINAAQTASIPVVFSPGDCYLVSASLQFKHGKSSSDTQSYSVFVLGNNAVIKPSAGIIAFQVNPRCLLADKATGRGVASIFISDIVFDGGVAGASSTRAMLIGTAGFVTDNFPYSEIRNVTVQNWGTAVTNAVQIQEARHLRLDRLVLRSNASMVIQATTAGSFAGDIVVHNSDFSGSGSQAPLTITANNGAQARGIKITDSDIYGGGSLLHSTGSGGSQVGDIWFTNVQFDTAAGSDIFLSIFPDTATAKIFDVHVNHSYFVTGTQGILVHTANSGTTQGIDLSNNWFNTMNVSSVSGDKAVIVGLSANGLIVNDNKFDTVTGGASTSYIEMDATTDFEILGNFGTNGSSVANGITTANACDRYSIFNNVVSASSALNDGSSGSPTKQTGNNLAVTQ